MKHYIKALFFFKLGIVILIFSFPINLISQITVGINSTPSKAALIDAKQQIDNNGLENATMGIKFPRVRLTNISELYPMLTGSESDYSTQKINNKGLIVYNVNTTSPFYEGLYCWNGSSWELLSYSKNLWKTDNANTMIVLNTKSDGVTNRTSGTDLVIKDSGTVGIGTTTPNSSAILDLTSTNKGFLAPRVTLTSINDVTTIPTPSSGMMVYNTGTGTIKYAGYVFWNGTEWRSMNNTTIANPNITSIDCVSATLFPNIYTSGTYYTGTLTLPYSDGNGGVYPGGTSVTVNGLTFKLLSGTLEYGTGYLKFSVMGTPTVTSPTNSNITINSTLLPFYTGGSCTTVEVGTSNTKSGDFISKSFTIDTNTPTNSVTCLDNGKLCVRYNGTSSSSQLQVRHNYANAQVLITYSFYGTGGPSGSGTLTQKNTNLASGTWTNMYDYGPITNTEGQITQFSLIDKITNEIRSFQVIGDMILKADTGGTIDKMFLRLLKN